MVFILGVLALAAAISKTGLDRRIGMLLLMLTFCGNVGGPGSPAAGGRNAVMLGILSDYGISLSFGNWVKMGMPFVPVMALVIAAYFLLVFRNRIKCGSVNIAAEVRRESEKIGKMTPDEYKAAGVLILLIVLWTTVSSRFGMGGPAILCLVLLNILGVLRWKDINSIHWARIVVRSLCDLGA